MFIRTHFRWCICFILDARPRCLSAGKNIADEEENPLMQPMSAHVMFVYSTVNILTDVYKKPFLQDFNKEDAHWSVFLVGENALPFSCAVSCDTRFYMHRE